jgi:hypothetical protein
MRLERFIETNFIECRKLFRKAYNAAFCMYNPHGLNYMPYSAQLLDLSSVAELLQAQGQQ